jgi:hypothetical protein
MIELIQQHPTLAFIVGYGIFASVVGAMEKPTEKNGPGYRYIYRLGHMLAFNWGHAIRVKFPEYIPGKAEVDAEETKVKES